jgi:hypothetical protein
MKNDPRKHPQAFNVPGWVNKYSLLRSSSSFGPDPRDNRVKQPSQYNNNDHYNNMKTSTLKKAN